MYAKRIIPKLHELLFDRMVDRTPLGRIFILSAPVNSYGNVGTLPPFYGTSVSNIRIARLPKCA